MRLSNLVSGILFALGVLCFIGANVALSEDKGSCVPGLVCDHTFAGTNIYILPVVRLLEALSILAFGAGIVVFVIYRHQQRADLPPPNEEKGIVIPPKKAYGRSGNHPMAGKTLQFKLRVTNIRRP